MTPEDKKKYFRMAFLAVIALAAIARHMPHTAPPLPAGDTIRGEVARVADAHTLYIHRNKLLVWGIGVPGKGTAGQEDAVQTLVALTKGQKLECTVMLVDPHDIDVVRCKLPDHRDLGEMMVRSGWARDYPRFTEGEYKPAEDAARAARLGQWAASAP